MKSLKINRLMLIGLSTALFAGGLGLVNSNVNASTKAVTHSTKTSLPSASSKYWNKYSKVQVTKNTPVYKYTLADPAYKSKSVKIGTIKKGTKVYVSNKMRKMADVSFPWVLKGGKYKTTNKVIYNVNNSKNNWFKLAK
ncbi:hypothetical protein GSH19_04985 [Lactobacillus sp. S2-2]|uniref:hypothetical protein n=1 Tax=Lactobacillus sp. S2-2 TaxID=2692917 RepID=UPI001F255AA2|nr:hypothetical protein [Lactobacillus sp. S2-2]MCF6515506.1 hypothetical protein [Lactobacillus sp. S2-2]